MGTDRKAQKRNRNSAKRAGAGFEIRQAEYLREVLDNPYISRQDKNGDKDLGDIAYVGYKGMGLRGIPIVLELKNTASVNLASANREAMAEADNYHAKHGGPPPLPVVMHKRHGVADASKQWVTMDAATFVRLLTAAETGVPF